MGPSDFNQGTGSRVASGTVWCVDALGTFHYDVLRPNSETEELEGAFPCFKDF
jgi:hypothetical protein